MEPSTNYDEHAWYIVHARVELDDVLTQSVRAAAAPMRAVNHHIVGVARLERAQLVLAMHAEAREAAAGGGFVRTTWSRRIRVMPRCGLALVELELAAAAHLGPVDEAEQPDCLGCCRVRRAHQSLTDEIHHSRSDPAAHHQRARGGCRSDETAPKELALAGGQAERAAVLVGLAGAADDGEERRGMAKLPVLGDQTSDTAALDGRAHTHVLGDTRGAKVAALASVYEAEVTPVGGGELRRRQLRARVQVGALDDLDCQFLTSAIGGAGRRNDAEQPRLLLAVEAVVAAARRQQRAHRAARVRLL